MYHFLLERVEGRGSPPVSFLDELVSWLKDAPADIFAPNDEPGDVFNRLTSILGPWASPLHRRATMGNVLLVLAGLESSWKWNEGVDVTNARSMAHPECQEAGAFQESYDSVANEHQHHTIKYFLAAHGVTNAQQFIVKSKKDHKFELEYTARLLRVTTRCNGPIIRGELDRSMSRKAVAEILTLIS